MPVWAGYAVKPILLRNVGSIIQNLQHQLHLFRTARFGRKTEKGVVAEQLSLQFDDAQPAIEYIQSANLLSPLVKLMEADIHHHYDIAYVDETPLQVLKEKDRLPTQKSYMWLFTNIHNAETVEQLEKLLPYNIDLALIADMRSIPQLIMPEKDGVN